MEEESWLFCRTVNLDHLETLSVGLFSQIKEFDLDTWRHIGDANCFLRRCSCSCLECFHRLEDEWIFHCSCTGNKVRLRGCVLRLRANKNHLLPVSQEEEKQEKEEQEQQAAPPWEQATVIVFIRGLGIDTFTVIVNGCNIIDIAWTASTLDFKFVEDTIAIIVFIDLKTCSGWSIWQSIAVSVFKNRH